MKRIVIVGGGFAGLTAARVFKGAPVQVTLIDRSNHHLFQPLLYQVATAGLSPADIAMPIRSILKNQKNVEVLMAEVTGVEKKERVINLKDRKIPYDYLILATGARHSYFGHDQWQRFAPGLKSVADATAIRRRILLAFESAEMESDPIKRKAWLTFILVGGGPTGVEMAGSIAELAFQALRSDFRQLDPRQARIILVEAGERVLSSFPPYLSERAQKKLENLGVELSLNGRVEKIDEDGVFLRGQKISAKTVIWCAGVQASSAGSWIQAETDGAGRVRVKEDLTVPGYPEIFVIGDTASVTQDGSSLPGVAPVAMQQGKYAANTILKRIEGISQIPAFRYRDKGNLATVGRTFAVADFKGIRAAGFMAWIVWVFVHIYYLIGFRNRIVVLLEWAWAYLTFERGARLITMENPED